MRVAGLLLLPAGWLIVLAAIALLPAAAWRAAFGLAGVLVELLGLVVFFRSFVKSGRQKEDPFSTPKH